MSGWGVALSFVAFSCKEWSPWLQAAEAQAKRADQRGDRAEAFLNRDQKADASPQGAAIALAAPLGTSGSSQSLRVRNRRLIIDVGFNEGGDAYHYLSHGYDVVGVEANPRLIEKAKADPVFKQFVEIGQLRLLQAGICGEQDKASAELTFWEHPKKSYWGQLGKPHQACKDHSKNPPRMECIAHKVPMMTCQDVMDKMGVPLYMKIDIEKQDGDCILSLAERPDPCQLPFYISFERSAKFQDAMKHLGRLGYKYFKQVLQREWDRKQKFTSVKQASGPFGEWAVDTLSARVGTEQLGHLWKFSNNSGNLFGKNERPAGDWVDIHGRLDGPPTVCG